MNYFRGAINLVAMTSWKDNMTSWKDKMTLWKDNMTSWKDKMTLWKDRNLQSDNKSK